MLPGEQVVQAAWTAARSRSRRSPSCAAARLANAFVILDEAQNTTPVQMKMFLTRLGENARMAVTGDLSQIDLPRGTRSGLRDALDTLAGRRGHRRRRVHRGGRGAPSRWSRASSRAYDRRDRKRRGARRTTSDRRPRASTSTLRSPSTLARALAATWRRAPAAARAALVRAAAARRPRSRRCRRARLRAPTPSVERGARRRCAACARLNRRWRGRDAPTNVLVLSGARASDAAARGRAAAAGRCRAGLRDRRARGRGARQDARRPSSPISSCMACCISSASTIEEAAEARAHGSAGARACWRGSASPIPIACGEARRWLTPADGPPTARRGRGPVPRPAQLAAPAARRARGRADAARASSRS